MLLTLGQTLSLLVGPKVRVVWLSKVVKVTREEKPVVPREAPRDGAVLRG